MNLDHSGAMAPYETTHDLPAVFGNDVVVTVLPQLSPELRRHALTCPHCRAAPNLTVNDLTSCFEHPLASPRVGRGV